MHSIVSRLRACLAGAALACGGVAVGADLVALPGHVLPALSEGSTVVARTKSLAADDEPVTLTVVLRREHEVAFQAFLDAVQVPASPSFRRYRSPVDVSDRYGPSQASYDAVRAHFESQGFVLVEGSANRLTLTMRGTRAMAEAALSTRIVDYRIGDKAFRANAEAPKLPADIAGRVQAVVGLSTLAQPRPMKKGIHEFCNNLANNESNAAAKKDIQDFCSWLDTLIGYPKALVDKAGNADWAAVSGAGQTIGVVSFSTYARSDVIDFLALMDLPALAPALSDVHVNGGASSGDDAAEVLVDLATIMTIARGAQFVVFDAPFTGGGTSFQAVLNAMVGAGVTIISNSWAYCENQTTPADVQSIDAIFQAAAASGISAFNASGDSGSTCLNGAPNVVHVPASSPHATAVGGTSHQKGPGRTYGSETWWDGSADTPPTGQGGYGVSQFFARPAYQDAHVASPMRSVPDVAINADPAHGIVICQSDDGGCPSGALWGGTSMSAPAWAAIAALVNEAVGANLGDFNAAIYPHAGPAAFHDAASMGSDFSHVGLGSPITDALALKLAGRALGAPSASRSTVVVRSTILDGREVTAQSEVPADGVSQAVVVVTLRDADGHAIGGNTIALAANAGSSAIVTPASIATTTARPFAVFTVTDLATESVTLTATDTTDGLALTPTAQVTFGVPAAAAASIVATPSSVLNDGVATTTITVTLEDALGRPSPGKLIVLSQGSGHSVISGPSPSVTDASGTIVFTATDTHAEVVTYTAVDVTDGDLPVPGNAIVDFNGQATSTCVTTVPTAAPGFAITPWSSGYPAAAFVYSGISFGCAGASSPVFDDDGSAFVASFTDGKLFHLPPTGGAASSGFLLATHGPTLSQPVFGKDGRLYAARGATGSGVFSGAILELDPDDGSIVRTLVSGAWCPQGLAVDPLSGDLFYDGTCFGSPAEPRVFRISNPATTPTVSTYATMPAPPSGHLAFAPDGTLFVQSNYLDAAPKVQRISGTDKPQPATVTEVPGLTSIFWVTIGETSPSGAAKSLIVLGSNGLRLADITTDPPTFTELTVGGSSTGVVGPDGCLYFSATEVIFRLSKDTGECGFDVANALPALALSPSVVAPDPAQGSTVALEATFSNLAVPTGTGVTLVIKGANPRIRFGRTDASGRVALDYQGIVAGDDRVTALATVGGKDYQSNTVHIRWTPAKHATFVTTAPSSGGGSVGAAVTLRATLVDIAVDPSAPIAGAAIHFTLGALACDGVTDAQGTAACDVVPAGPGTSTLAASFAGDATFLPSSATQGFQTLAAPDPACFTGVLPGDGTASACVAGTLSTCQFATASFVATASVGSPPPADVTLPFGLFQFVATGCGSSATLTLTYPGTLPANATYWKFGPTTGLAAHWYSIPAQVAGNTLTVTIVDGGAGDSDLAANGSISDPGGAGVLAVVSAPSVPVPTLNGWALSALALLLLAAARRRVR